MRERGGGEGREGGDRGGEVRERGGGDERGGEVRGWGRGVKIEERRRGV